MAITSADIHNQSFSIDRKGYDVDEVDVFLEHVADEIDGLNGQIERLEDQLGSQDEETRFDGFDTPATLDEEPPEPVVDDSLLAEKDEIIAERDARIAELESQLEAKKADDNAIAQALIIAQRSADEIKSAANAQAAQTIQQAEDEADRIMERVEGEKQKVLDAIQKLEDDREDAREEYQDLLKDFISDASRKLADIGGDMPAVTGFSSAASAGAYARSAAPAAVSEAPAVSGATSSQAPIRQETIMSTAYATPQPTGSSVAVPTTPKASPMEKDLSGFGDADDDFEFEEID